MKFDNRKHENIFLLVIAAIVVTIFSRCSFLYPFNGWCDANAYFTVGKAILNGHVPYRDLFDHKGPLFFFIQTTGALISYKSFIGIYFLEVIACFLFLFFSVKTVRLFYTPKYTLLDITLLSVVVYSSFCFALGDSVEEFALPILTFSLYSFLKIVQGKEKHLLRNAISVGVAMSIIFWMKYNIMGFFIGIYIALFIYTIVKHDWRTLFKYLAFNLLGFIPVSFFIILFFVCNGALEDLINSYFLININNYGVSFSPIDIICNIFKNGCDAIIRDIALTLVIVAGLVFIRKEYSRGIVYASLITLCISLFFSVKYFYYPFVLSCFAPFAIIVFDTIVLRNKRLFIILAAVVTSVLTFTNRNLQSLVLHQNDWVFDFSDYIKNQCSSKNATVMYYGTMDIGVNTLLGYIPQVKYFYRPNTATSFIDDAQLSYLQDKKVDYFISDKKIENCNYRLVLSNGNHALSSYYYRLFNIISEQEFLKNYWQYYYLYEKIN